MCWQVSPIFPNTISTLKQSLTLTNTLLSKVKLNTLDCYADLKTYINTTEISRLQINLEEITRLPFICSR